MASMPQRGITVGLLLLLTGLTSALKGPPKLSAFPGRTLSVACQYGGGYRTHQKYWCQGSESKDCTIVVQTDGTETEVTSGRTSIQDNQTRSEFIVRLENFSQEDVGIYWCGITVTGWDPIIRIEIIALPAPTPTTVSSTNVPTLPDSPTTPTPSPEFQHMILLPIVFLVLVVILIGAVLLMCRLKKQRAAKASKDVPLSLAPSASVQQNDGYHHAPSSNQGPDSAREVEYAFVKVASTSVPSLPQVSTDTEDVSYCSITFSALEEEATYANVK
ncbi:hypothetical protein JRQ81_002145 [Phrynocephalus forsythii]|uniref:Ig-like domain-containing protein n=1 Tax=Phrynocephalus forsythii TaxID=171643 RepID=A0A9Q0XJK2_9SAUR|nr:hypothetical protein JRQ81_002145 [Phrynocephalus forsythii]